MVNTLGLLDGVRKHGDVGNEFGGQPYQYAFQCYICDQPVLHFSKTRSSCQFALDISSVKCTLVYSEASGGWSNGEVTVTFGGQLMHLPELTMSKVTRSSLALLLVLLAAAVPGGPKN